MNNPGLRAILAECSATLQERLYDLAPVAKRRSDSARWNGRRYVRGAVLRRLSWRVYPTSSEQLVASVDDKLHDPRGMSITAGVLGDAQCQHMFSR